MYIVCQCSLYNIHVHKSSNFCNILLRYKNELYVTVIACHTSMYHPCSRKSHTNLLFIQMFLPITLTKKKLKKMEYPQPTLNLPETKFNWAEVTLPHFFSSAVRRKVCRRSERILCGLCSGAQKVERVGCQVRSPRGTLPNHWPVFWVLNMPF